MRLQGHKLDAALTCRYLESVLPSLPCPPPGPCPGGQSPQRGPSSHVHCPEPVDGIGSQQLCPVVGTFS